MSMLKSQSPAEQGEDQSSISCNQNMVGGVRVRNNRVKIRERSKVDRTKGPHTVSQIICSICKQDDATLVAV
jgi:hypothetical protein